MNGSGKCDTIKIIQLIINDIEDVFRLVCSSDASVDFYRFLLLCVKGWCRIVSFWSCCILLLALVLVLVLARASRLSR